MKDIRNVDVPRLFRVWNNQRFTTDEVAAILLLSRSALMRLAAKYKLPPRHFVTTSGVDDEPPQAEVAEQERRKAECRERHLAQRRSEEPCNTFSKVSKWRRGICEPLAGHHT